jgi:predicted DNA-binding protein with PD1-like motif
MEYAVGKTGRIIAARLYEGEDLHESIHKIAAAEGVKSAAVFITGGFREASVVVGPKQEVPKIVADFRHFAGPGEVLGVGTIYWDNEGPRLHIHTAIGTADEVIVGCSRDGTKTFLILEVTIIEIEGLHARRKPDENTGLNLLKFE